MKQATVWYWIITVLFSGYMIFTAFGNVISDPQSVEIIGNQMGYPKYLIPFIGIAKVLGAITILIPGLNRIKEWAYAGLFFDLAGAAYSVTAVWGLQPTIVFILLPMLFLFASYFLWHRIKSKPYSRN